MPSTISVQRTATAAREGSQLAAAAAATAGGSAQAQAEPSPSRRHISQLWAPSFRGDFAIQTHVAVLQVAVAISQWQRADTLEAKLAPCIPMITPCILLALMLLCPRAYWQARDWMMPALMVLMACLPLYRRLDTGLALLLRRAPQPGWRGAAMDTLRTAAGMRSLGLALIACCHVLPPLPALLLQAGHTALTWNPGYCSTLLLAAPLAQQRQAALARVLELGSLPLAAVQPIAGQLAATFEDPHALCVATAAWLHLTVQLILPTLFQAWLWTPPALSPPPPPPPPATSRARRAWRQLRRAAEAGDRGVHLALGGAAGPLVRAAVAYYLLANCWMLAKV